MRRLLWFRRDLRMEDNPLLAHAGEVLPLFIFDPNILSPLSPHDRRVSFIFESLIHLKAQLHHHGLDVAVFYGNPTDVVAWLLTQGHFDEVVASGDYDPYSIQRDTHISHLLPFNALRDTYLLDPNEVLKSDGTPYLVFTPFYNQVKKIFSPDHIAPSSPSQQTLIPFDYDVIHQIHDTHETLLPLALESIGCIPQPLPFLSLDEKLNRFREKIAQYSHDREIMALEATSGLSVHLRFGTLSIRALMRFLVERKKEGIETEPFFRQLIFREFYAMLLYHFPHLVDTNFRYSFKGTANKAYFEAFCTAQTGVPMVDAGIRELLASGEMHNRVRMICASFFTKNLLLPWQWGEAFFARHLLDYDTASNVLSWQWSAGTGIDPQPYFRIFNPYTQTAKFDKEGRYITRHLPQLAHVPPKIFSDETALTQYRWGEYPPPIVNHKESAQKALAYYKTSLVP